MFFETLDNSHPVVKINFISDDVRANVINLLARQKGIPPVSSPSLSGGYRYPILEDIAEDRVFQILKAKLPRGDAEVRSYIRTLLSSPETLYGYADEGDVTIVQIEGWNRTETPLSTLGWHITSGPKTFKRLKTLNRPFRLGAKLDRPLRVAIVDDDAYTNEDLSIYSPGDVEKLLDGAFVISREMFQICIDKVEFPTLNDTNDPQLDVDWFRMEEYFRQAQFFHAFNARLFGPMHFIGVPDDDPLYEAHWKLKGEAFIDVSDTCERMKVDIICTRSALKHEVGNDSRTYVLLEPQKAKRSGVNSDLQTAINLPGVYQPEFVAEWINEFLHTNFNRLKNNELMEEWFSMAIPYFNAGSKIFAQNDVSTLTKWNARAWLMSGRRITESTWIFEQMASAISRHIKSTDQSRLRFPVPCAVRAQVISQSFASMAGWDITVQLGSARWVDELEAIVVNDHDWIEMYHSHGGHDLDDFFVGYYRTFGNRRVIILVRSPNDWGEYSIFDYVEGDWYPEFEKHDGSFMVFPEVNTNPELWPVRLSDALNQELVRYTGMPSSKDKKEFVSRPYSTADVLEVIDNNTSSANSVGLNVNARSLWALTKKTHRPVQLASMEACIDTGTQGGSSEDAEAVIKEAKSIVAEIIAGDDPIDAYMWDTRFSNSWRTSPLPAHRLTTRTHISAAHELRNKAAKQFMDMARTYSQNHIVKNFDPKIHQLGARFLAQGYNALINTRLSMWQAQSFSGSSLIPDNWFDLHSFVLEKLNSFEDEVDRHDFVLAIYSSCFKAPARSTGKISDQLVMNPHIFPYLLDAMRFYGLAYYINVDENGQIVRHKVENWTLSCVSCDTQFVTEDPYKVQKYHANKGFCKKCRTINEVTEEQSQTSSE